VAAPEALHLFVDESIHHGLGFIVTAFVFARTDVGPLVRDSLASAGMMPGRDEFKSSEPMASNPAMRSLRERLLRIASDHTTIAALVTPSDTRPELGAAVIDALDVILRKNGMPLPLCAWFDQGMFRSTGKASRLAASVASLATSALAFEQDSRAVLGLQLADAVAHLVAQVLREEVSGVKKPVGIGGPDTGYADGTIAPLGWALLMTLRYAFLVRPVVPEGREATVPADMEPLVVPEDEDYVSAAQHPHFLGWGVIVSDGVDVAIARAAEVAFSNNAGHLTRK